MLKDREALSATQSFKHFHPDTRPIEVNLLRPAITPGNRCTLCIFGA
jgi:hypothetical protein